MLGLKVHHPEDHCQHKHTLNLDHLVVIMLAICYQNMSMRSTKHFFLQLLFCFLCKEVIICLGRGCYVVAIFTVFITTALAPHGNKKTPPG